MELMVVGLSHKTAPVQLRERFAIAEEGLPGAAERVQVAGGRESFVISTCNRTEFYVSVEEGVSVDARLVEVMAQIGASGVATLSEHVYIHRGSTALRHLFRVAASLDSLVVGEAQILGQLRGAFEVCRQAGHTGPTLDRAAERAFAVARKVRSQTGIGKSSVSVSSVAVDLARQIFGDLSGRRAVLLGAGKMGELAARHLKQGGVAELLVANRNFDRARAVAENLGGHPRDLSELADLLIQADIVIASTGARSYIVDVATMKRVLKARKYRPVFLIDIAVPRNIDPALNELDNVFVYDVDDLSEIANENLAARHREAQAAEQLVESELEKFIRDLQGLSVKPTIVALRAEVQKLRDAELEKALAKMGEVDPRTRQALERLADGLVNKLLHPVMTELKRAATEPDGPEVLDVTRRLFGIEADPPKDE